MRSQYLELAQQASVFEQLSRWEEAGKCWLEAIKFASGANKLWANARFEFCCQQVGVRPLAFLNSFG
ncbi:ANR family transcriptional regulator [Vibrio jasicida]|uniref:ANR family transcriptional regulator n=1 Tax=Vibrio jasicida TaxID=766224 RepID=UPI000CE2C8A1